MRLSLLQLQPLKRPFNKCAPRRVSSHKPWLRQNLFRLNWPAEQLQRSLQCKRQLLLFVKTVKQAAYTALAPGAGRATINRITKSHAKQQLLLTVLVGLQTALHLNRRPLLVFAPQAPQLRSKAMALGTGPAMVLAAASMSAALLLFIKAKRKAPRSTAHAAALRIQHKRLRLPMVYARAACQAL